MGLIEQAARDVTDASVFIPQRPKNSLFLFQTLFPTAFISLRNPLKKSIAQAHFDVKF